MKNLLPYFFIMTMLVLPSLTSAKAGNNCPLKRQIMSDLTGSWRVELKKGGVIEYLTVQKTKNQNRYHINYKREDIETKEVYKQYTKTVNICSELELAKSEYEWNNGKSSLTKVMVYTLISTDQSHDIQLVTIKQNGKYVWCWLNTMSDGIVSSEKK